MKECATQLMLFKGLSGKKIEVDFDGGEVSSDAGLLFLRETEAKHGIIRRMANVLRDRRHKSYITHDLLDLFPKGFFRLLLDMRMPMILMIFVRTRLSR